MNDEVTRVQQDISDALDEKLLAALKQGGPLRDGKGNPLVDREGNALMEGPTAAVLNVARQRMKDLGITPSRNRGDTLEKVIAELGLRDTQLPPVSNEDDPATR